MPLLRNIWYMAGWSDDIGRTPLLRTIANVPVLLYRSEAGSVIALSDTCPHRFAPLHQGILVGDAIQCPYHGLRFGPAGECVHNPHGKHGVIPKAARVRAFDVLERDSIVWVWIGDPGSAARTGIPDFPLLNVEASQYTATAGATLHMDLQLDLIIDNLLDLGHVAFLHRNNLGSEALERARIGVRQVGQTLYSDRLGPNGLPAPVFVMTGACQATDYVDYWLDMRWDAPGSFYLDAGIVAAGRPRREGCILSSVQILTPETDRSSHYFFKIFRNYNREAAGLSEAIVEAVKAAFRDEDERMVRMVSQRMQGRDLLSLNPVMLPADAAAVRARRILEALARSEAGEHG